MLTIWHGVKEMDLSCNNIETVDSTIELVPNVHTLILSRNKLTEIANLSALTKLSRLLLSNNQISKCDDTHMKLGNIVYLDLSQNNITLLNGLGKLYSLENLDLSCNQIIDVNEVKHIGGLPCLEYLRLTGNPLAITVDYRVRVLEHFGVRATEIYLDNEKPTQKEIDTIFILQALRIVKEGKIPTFSGDEY